jgi:hypothetical protein
VTLCRLPTYGSRAEPSKVANVTLECLFHDYAGLRRDIRPAGSVIPVAVNPVRPSLPLPLHAGHCDDIPMLLECAGTRRRHDCHCAVYGPPVTGTLESAHGRRTDDQPLRRHPRSLSYTSTGLTTTPRQGEESPGRPSAPWHYSLLMVKIRQPSHEFTFGVGISFIPYPLVLTPVV